MARSTFITSPRPTARLLTAASIVLAIFGLLSDDLADLVHRGKLPTASGWTVSANGRDYVKALVVADGSDPEMTALRSAIIALRSCMVSTMCRPSPWPMLSAPRPRRAGEGRIMSLVSELKRRSVFKVGAAYAVAVEEVKAPAGESPDAARRLRG